MAKVKSLQSSEESKAKKAARELRFGNKTEKQKKFLEENSNVKTADEMEKKKKDYKTLQDLVNHDLNVLFNKHREKIDKALLLYYVPIFAPNNSLGFWQKYLGY